MEENVIEKEQIIKAIIAKVGSQFDGDQLREIINAITTSIEDIDFVQRKQFLTTEVTNNVALMQRFFAIQKIIGLKDSTLKAYLYCLNSFLGYYDCIDIRKVTTDHIRRYLLEMQKNQSQTTVNNTRIYLNVFFKTMVNEHVINFNPVSPIPPFKQAKKEPKWYSKLEMEKMRDSCQDKREIALVDLLLSTGMRVSEVAALKISDVNNDKNEISVIDGKGGKDRIIPMSVRCKKHLNEYIAEHRFNGEYVFEPRINNRNDYGVTTTTINSILHDIGSRCGLPTISCHDFRRFFATTLVQKNFPPEVIQSLMGHESIDTTMRHYVKKDKAKMHSFVDQFIA